MPQINLRALLDRHQEIGARIGEIADLCETENRDATEAEQNELAALRRERSLLNMRLDAAQNRAAVPAVDPDTQLRQNMREHVPTTVRMVRDLMTSPAVEGTGIIPVAQQEMIKPIRTGLIWDKVGITVRTGLPAGELRWPKHGKATAQWVGEGERVEDTSIDFSKLSVTPERLSCAIPLTKELLESTAGIVENVVREEMPAAVTDLVNAAIFTTVGTYTDAKDGKTKNKKVVGPLVAAYADATEFAAAVPTRKELLKLKTKVVKALGTVDGGCWVMTEDMKAELEDVKVDAGSGRFVCENGMILGFPVFTTPEIGEGNIAFGDWSWQAAGFFGSMDLAVDPYTLLRQNSTDFVLNGHFGTVTLRPEAFAMGKAKA